MEPSTARFAKSKQLEFTKSLPHKKQKSARLNTGGLVLSIII
ncbi:hypothetical protein l13_14620 [Neisseria weaveri ATCC 51223]|nr:hypothetical protein l13_14620 [Neisseria weaveri ATCC 51223]